MGVASIFLASAAPSFLLLERRQKPTTAGVNSVSSQQREQGAPRIASWVTPPLAPRPHPTCLPS